MQHPCPRCGTLIASEAMTCPSCGSPLNSLDVAPPAASPESVPAPRKKRPIRLIVGVLLVVIAIPLALGGLLVGGFLSITRHVSAPAQATPVLQAALYADNLTQDHHAWQCAPFASCQYQANGLHILAPTDHLYFSTLSGQVFGEEVIDVQEKLDNGDPQFVGVAIAFRSIGLDGYGFLVYANGTYEFVKWSPKGDVTILIPLTPSIAIHTGLEQTNDLKIIAKGADITMFSNGQQLNQINDTSFSSGNVALGAARFAADAVFSNLVITSP
jgi:zinc-ribbon domain